MEVYAPAVRAPPVVILGLDELTAFVGHQANYLMLQAVARRADISPELHWHNVEHYGNTGASGAPTT